jgi:hypothetical protein
MKRNSTMATKTSPKEMRLHIDAKTMQRKADLFVDGDFARIAEDAATTAKKVMDCFRTGIAPQSLALAMKKYYAAKDRAQKALSA